MKPTIASLQAEVLQLRKTICSMEQQIAREREDGARRVIEAKRSTPGGEVETLRAQITQLQTENAALTKARDKFKNDWTEALRWSGHWKTKYQMLSRKVEQAVERVQARREGGTFQERKAAAIEQAKRTGEPVRV